MKSNSDNEDGITTQSNYNTLKLPIIFAHSYQIDFTINNGLRYILGFDANAWERMEDTTAIDKSTSQIST